MRIFLLSSLLLASIKVSARDDGSFTVTNARNGFTKTYAAASR